MSCEAEGCEREAHCRGYCEPHYRRLLRHGDPLAGKMYGYPEEARFWAKVNKDGPGGCWLWTASTFPNGYGQFGGQAKHLAHRYAYEHLVAAIPEGLTLHHLCGEKRCVNPDHLEPVSQRENLWRDAAWVGRRRDEAGRFV